MLELEQRMELVETSSLQGPNTDEHKSTRREEKRDGKILTPIHPASDVFQHQTTHDNKIYLTHDLENIFWIDDSENRYHNINLRHYIMRNMNKKYAEEIIDKTRSILRAKVTGIKNIDQKIENVLEELGKKLELSANSYNEAIDSFLTEVHGNSHHKQAKNDNIGDIINRYANASRITGLSVDDSGLYFSIGHESVHRLDLDAEDDTSALELVSMKREFGTDIGFDRMIEFFEVIDGRVYLGINKPGSRENQLYIIKNQDSLELYRNPDFEEDPIPIKMIPQKSGDYLVLRTGKNHFRLIKDGRISRPIKVEGLNTEPEEYHICNGRAYWNDGGLNLRFAEIDEEGAFDYTGVEEGHIKQHKLTEKAEEIQIHPEIKRQDYIIEEIVSNHGNLFVYERKHGSGNEDNRVAIIRDGRVIGEKHKGIHFRMLGSTEHTLYGKKQHNVFTRYRLQPRG